MKAVILWAGQGRRIQKKYGGLHKALIPLNGKPLLYYLLDNIRRSGIEEIVPVLGYRADEMLTEIEKNNTFKAMMPVYNREYERTNNLYSLVQAEKILVGENFIVINGDMVFDYRILTEIIKNAAGNAIAVDNKHYPDQLDSPRVLIENGRILDIGRHRNIVDATGYAIGVYKFSAAFSESYLKAGKQLTEARPQAGYHEPLKSMLGDTWFAPCIINDYVWMDVDEEKDVAKAQRMLNTLSAKER